MPPSNSAYVQNDLGITSRPFFIFLRYFHHRKY